MPTEIVLTVSPVFCSNMGTRTSSSPESWVLVVVDRMTMFDWAGVGAASTIPRAEIRLMSVWLRLSSI